MKIKLVHLAAAALATIGTSAPAAVIFSDTTGFANWYKGGTDGTLTKGVNTLGWAPNASGTLSQAIGRSFADTSLTVGDTIRFNFDWVQSSASVGIIRVGLYDIASPKKPIAADNWNNITVSTGSFTGYYTFARDLTGTASAPRKDADIFGGSTGLMSLGTNLNAGNSILFNLSDNGTITYNVSFSVTRDSASQISTNFVIKEGATERFNISGTDNSTPYTSFNFVGIRGTDGTMGLANLQVEVIPEPATMALLAGMTLTIVLRRRQS